MTALPFFHRHLAPVRKAFLRGMAVSILWGALLILAAFIMAGCRK